MVALVLFAGLLVGNWLGYELRAEPEAVTVVWPPSGLLLGALLLSEPRRWRLFLSLSVAAEVVAAALATWSLPEATMALPFALLNTGEALLAAALLRRVRPGLSFGRAGDLALFAAVGAGLAPLISGIAAGGLLVWQYEGLAWFAEAEKWALGNAVGVLVFAPPTVLWVTRPPRWTSSRRLVEGTIATVGMGATLLLVDRAGAGSVDHVFDLPVFLVPFLLFGAVRFGPRGVAAMAVAAVLLLVELMLVGGGLASRSITSHTQTVAVQAFLYVSVLTTYLLAATTVERQTAEDEA
ncbi:MAG: MASE1 domain-containing protein, partial [Myxococcota bacterium]|nr:MASE1 domain-containing protein [Myxococcota bacterium]